MLNGDLDLDGHGGGAGVIGESPRCLPGRKTARIAWTAVAAVGATAFPADSFRGEESTCSVSK